MPYSVNSDLRIRPKKKKLSKAEWDSIFASYKEEYGTDLETDMQDAERYRASEQSRKKIMNLLNEDGDDAEETTDVVSRVENLLQKKRPNPKSQKDVPGSNGGHS
ncbi:MAG: hypothetical protein LIP01_05280 [Tannerellaceae bacterium]|nr:hypothetical protein [Tannerellaceae bacterium]